MNYHLSVEEGFEHLVGLSVLNMAGQTKSCSETAVYVAWTRVIRAFALGTFLLAYHQPEGSEGAGAV